MIMIAIKITHLFLNILPIAHLPTQIQNSKFDVQFQVKFKLQTQNSKLKSESLHTRIKNVVEKKKIKLDCEYEYETRGMLYAWGVYKRLGACWMSAHAF